MRIYTKLVIDMQTLQLIEEDCERINNYHGPIAECKGGAGDTVDKDYNAGMLQLSREQQAMAKEMYNMYKYGVTYDPEEKSHSGAMIKNPNYKEGHYEYKTVTSPRGRDGTPREKVWVPGTDRFIPDPAGYTTRGALEGYNPDDYLSEMELDQRKIAAQGELLPLQTELDKIRLQEGAQLLKARGGMIQSLYKEALAGVDVDRRVAESRAGVEHAFKNQMGITNRNLSRLGIDPTSGRGLAMAGNVGFEKARATAAGEGVVRRGAEEENFQRKLQAAGISI